MPNVVESVVVVLAFDEVAPTMLMEGGGWCYLIALPGCDCDGECWRCV